MLEQVDLTKKLSKAEYKKQLPHLQRRLYDLQYVAWKSGVPSVILFEGWDAAGKGTTINTLTQRLDPRGFKLHPIRAARTYEHMHPWLWRFWLKLPNYGEMAIFDRSWYGRVLVERVEALTPMPDWIRAYEEINEFEQTLSDDGCIFMKFWLHISRKEQLRRFMLLSQDPAKAWQVSAEDWENHRKYDEYLAAVKDMLANTNTDHANWTVIPATNKHYRIYAVLRKIIETLERTLELEPTRWPEISDLEKGAALNMSRRTLETQDQIGDLEEEE